MPYKDPEKRRAYHRAASKRWNAAHPEKVQASSRRRQENGMARAQYLKDAFGITVEEYNRLLVSQGCRCAICRELPCKKRLAVDHDHETGKIRGLLCFECNIGLGKFRDSALMVEAALRYLTK